MKKKTWKTIALTSVSVAVASVVIAVKLAIELEEITGAFDSTTDMLKQMADDGEIQNLKIGDKPYEIEI